MWKIFNWKTFINNEIKKLNESILNDISNELGNFVDYRFFNNVFIVKKSTLLIWNNSLYCNIFVFGCS